MRCDLLSFYYLCRTGNNGYSGCYGLSRVVICFHFTIFVVLETTSVNHISSAGMLWFAFILLSLSYWKQLCLQCAGRRSCCDLLSFYYLCRTGNNLERYISNQNDVVICFHFTIFVVLETTMVDENGNIFSLWFAFILLSLSYWKQLFVITVFINVVVICFHFTIFVVLETTSLCAPLPSPWLWFAFILLSLSYWKQRNRQQGNIQIRCDLLSFYYLCRTGNNFRQLKEMVVPLWFAFILLSLSYWKQLLF